ncbi:MAG: alpha/beta fold hydrolase [Hyphomicrobiaceae bacterium]|nr:alpha/beta fold hydrolase [Hyphomicrobiaceae bacterium]
MKKKQNSSGYLSSVSFSGGRTGVLLVHSLGGTPLELKYVAQGLSRAGYTVHCPMLPGLTHGTDVLSLSRWQDWYAELERAFDELRSECDTILVGGLSAGAILALHLASRRQSEIAGVISFAPTLWPNGWAVPWTFNFFRLVYTRWFSRLFRFQLRAPYGIKDERLRTFMEDSIKADNRTVGEVYSRSGVTVLEFTRLVRKVESELPGLKLPTLIIHPRHDDQSHIDNALRIQRQLAGPVETVILDDCFHVVTLDRQRDVVLDRTLEFAHRVLAKSAAAQKTDQRNNKTATLGVEA